MQLVADVAPFEFMKIRMLNGTHSTLAYLGYLSGHKTIAETVANPVFEKLVRKIWTEEIIPTLAPPEGVDLQSYADQLLERYANPAIQHRAWQIAMDGSQKLPQRILGTVADNLASGRICEGLLLAVVAWMRYVGGVDESGQAIDVRDPLADRLLTLSQEAKDPKGTVDALLSLDEVFGTGILPSLRRGVQVAYERLVEKGAEASARDLI